MKIDIPDAKEIARSKTIAGIAALSLLLVARSLQWIDDGPWFQAAIGSAIGLAGFGFMGVIQKVVKPLHKLIEMLPSIESAAGLPNTDVSKIKVDGKSLGSSGAATGLVGLVATIVGHTLGLIDEQTYEAALAITGGMVGIGGRVVVQKVIIIITRLLQVLPAIEAGINAMNWQKSVDSEGESGIIAPPEEEKSPTEDEIKTDSQDEKDVSI